MAGDSETGVAVMRMEEGLDTGPVAMVERVAIGPDMTAGDVHDRLMPLGADLMARALAALSRGALQFTSQPDEGVTYAKKITNEEARIDWSRPAQDVHNHVRGLSPFPGAFFAADLGKGPERVKVLRTALTDGAGAPGTLLDDCGAVACGDGAVRLLQVQRAGKGAHERRRLPARSAAWAGDRLDRLTEAKLLLQNRIEGEAPSRSNWIV